MNKDQLNMLSVKSAIERSVQGYIAAYVSGGDYQGFFDEVERYVASLFVSRQISNNYSVRSQQNGDLEVKFVASGQYSALHFMLPPSLRWQRPKAEGLESITPPFVPDQTAEEKFNELAPRLEAVLGMYLDHENTATTRERVKSQLYDILNKGGLDPSLTFITCDETNNSLSDRVDGLLTVDIQAQYYDPLDPIFEATIQALIKPSPSLVAAPPPPPPKPLRKVAKNDPNLATAILTARKTIGVMLHKNCDVTGVISNGLTYVQMAVGKLIHKCWITNVSSDRKKDLVSFDFNVQVYEDSETLVYPISIPVVDNKSAP